MPSSRTNRRSPSCCPTAPGTVPPSKTCTTPAGRESAGHALAKHLTGAGLDGGPEPRDSESQGEPNVEMMEWIARMQKNIDFFLAHMFRAICAYLPDTARLRAVSIRIVVAVGETSQGQVASCWR